MADRSPSQTAVSPSVLPDLKRRLFENTRKAKTRVSLFQAILPKPVDSDDASVDVQVILGRRGESLTLSLSTVFFLNK